MCISAIARVRATYNLSLQEYDTLIAQPCAICHTNTKPRVVDHCHVTGKVRGALCVSCNKRVSMAKYAELQEIIDYVSH
jgi:hypothetical protein